MTIDPYDVIFVDMAQRWSTPPLTFNIPDTAWESMEETVGGKAGQLRATFLLNGVIPVTVEISATRSARGGGGTSPACPRLRVGRRWYRFVSVDVVPGAPAD